MRISVSRAATLLLADCYKVAAVSAMLAVVLLVALSTEQSHAHENNEREFECEICLKLSFGDDLLIATANAGNTQITTQHYVDPVVSAPDSLAIGANSRAPPLV